MLASTDDLIKNTAIREIERTFTCNVAIGHRVAAAGGLHAAARAEAVPRDQGRHHTAVSTPGDLLYHIRARTMDLIVAFERNLLMAFGDAVEAVDDVAGFRYFDGRDLLDFVDGTANPEGLSLPEATIVGDEDPDHAGGSYVVVQKYLHNLDAWRAQKTEAQERSSAAPSTTTSSWTTRRPMRRSRTRRCAPSRMPTASTRSCATTCRSPTRSWRVRHLLHRLHRRLWVIEKMLERMFIGNPAPLHDRILDFSTATTGVTFFAPSRKVLADLGE